MDVHFLWNVRPWHRRLHSIFFQVWRCAFQTTCFLLLDRDMTSVRAETFLAWSFTFSELEKLCPIDVVEHRQMCLTFRSSWIFCWWHTGLDDHGWYAEDHDVSYTAEQWPRRRHDRIRRQGKKKDKHRNKLKCAEGKQDGCSNPYHLHSLWWCNHLSLSWMEHAVCPFVTCAEIHWNMVVLLDDIYCSTRTQLVLQRFHVVFWKRWIIGSVQVDFSILQSLLKGRTSVPDIQAESE